MKGMSRQMKISAVSFKKSMYAQPEDVHDHVEIIFCKEGNGAVIANGVAHPVHAGDIVYIPPNMRHADICTEPRKNGMMCFASVASLPSDLRIFQDPNRRLEKLFDLASDALLLPNLAQQAFAYSLGDAMLLLLLEWFAEPVHESNAAVEAIDKLIRQRFQEPDLNLTEEIQQSGYSVSYFRQLFRQQIGRPPQAQLNYVRIEFAKSQMQIYGESIPLKTISANSGFQDPYYFSRVFKQYVGMAPTEYLTGLGA